MKILFLTNLYPPYVRGGAEFLGVRVVSELARQGHKVAVVTGVPWRGVKRLSPEVRDEGGITVYRFFPLNIYHYLSGGKYPVAVRFLWHLMNLWNVHSSRVVKRIVSMEQPELAISYNLMGLGFNLPLLLKRLKVPHVPVLHDVQLLHPSGLFMWGKVPRSLAMSAYQFVTRRLFGRVTVAASPSAWLLREHEARGFFGGSQRVVLPNPVPPSLAESAIKGSHAPFTLLYVGQFQAHKGVFWLTETLKSTRRHDFVLHLVTVGQKPDVKRLKELIGTDERFVLHDLVNQSEVDKYLSESHLTVMPSLCYENSPTVIAQSLASGTPVLGSRLGGIPELIEEGKTGWLFEPGAPKDFLVKLNWCLAHPDEMLKAGLAGSKAMQDRTLESYAMRLASFAPSRVNEL